MQKYTGFYICPYCEEKFEWEYIDDGCRKGSDFYVAEAIDAVHNPSVAQCKISISRTGAKVLTGHCTHCQAFVEIKGTGNIPKELFS